MIKQRSCLYILALLLLSTLARAQVSSCEETLNSARNELAQGHLYGIPALLKPCLDRGFNKSQKIEAYWLLTRTYLLIDDPISAEDSYLKLLSLDPEYDIDEERDPVDVVYLSEKFTTTPIFILFAKTGVNLTQPNVIHNFGVDNTDFSSESYSNKIGFNLAAGSEFNMSDNFSLGLEFQIAFQNYSYSNNLFNNDLQRFDENLTVVNVPIYFKYRFKVNKFTPFVYAGFSNDLILNSQAELELIDRELATGDENSSEFSVTGPEIGLTEQRNFYNYSVIGGIGANYRIGYNYLFVDIRYAFGLTNIVNIDNQYDNPELLYRYGYVDDYKRLSNIMISVGYIYPLYKPRKKSEKVGFLRQIFNKN